VLMSPYDPGAGFNVGHAMQRNKLIYALADASLVVSSDVDKGGTWAGAVEQLDKLRFVPIYVRSVGAPSRGLDALLKKGALAWPNPDDVESFEHVFVAPAPTAPDSDQGGLPLLSSEDRANGSEIATPIDLDTQDAPQIDDNPAEILFAAVREAVEQLLNSPMKESDVAAALDVSTAQAKVWLDRLVREHMVEKTKKPNGYVIKGRQLFE
jgi:predicted Rossmann fold nucleotide-binding protein DprA/Smf involved in DNA uptake